MLLEKIDQLENVTARYNAKNRGTLIQNLTEAILENFSIDPYAKNLICIYSVTGTETCNKRAIQTWVEKTLPKYHTNNNQDTIELLHSLFIERYNSFSQALS